MGRTLALVSAVALTAAMTGCTQRLGDFTALSTKNVPLRYEPGASTRGSDCVLNILGFPLGFPNLEEAVDDAIGNRGNALVNQVTYQRGWTAILVGQQCIDVKGDVVTLK